MRRILQWLALGAGALAILSALGCSSSSTLVGKWTTTYYPDATTMELFKDGTYSSTFMGTGDYRIINDGKTLEINDDGTKMTWPFTLSGDTLTVKLTWADGSGGNEVVFTRSSQ